jgi:hypothetical protein
MLTAEERMELDVLRNHGQGIRKLARVTGRLHNTVPRCLREGEAAAVRKPARKTAAKRKNARYADFLEEVLRGRRVCGRAGCRRFPAHKTLETYDFAFATGAIANTGARIARLCRAY